MHARADIARDPFRFSLRGMATLKPVTFVPALADDAISRRLDNEARAGEPASRAFILQVENCLARYFAPGRCEA
jgi:hypothetical protein